MNYTCSDCKYALEDYNDKMFCTKKKINITDAIHDEADKCKSFKKLEFCDTCQYCKSIVYETGTIDCIDYRCILQNNKFIYSNNNPMTCQNAKFPECNLGMYEEDKNATSKLC